MKKLVSFLRGFTVYQKCYLIVVLLLTAAFVLFFPELMLEESDSVFVLTCSVVSVLANPVCELLISKQSRWNFIVSVIFVEIPEIILSFALGWYTLAAITLVFWMPIDIASFVKWSRHPDAEEDELTVVKRLTWKQDVFALLAILVFGFGVGFLISLIPGASDSYLDALTAGFGMANGILLLLRYSEQWYAWFITLILYVILYASSGSYIMLITIAAMLVNTCYGFGKWLKYTRTHGGGY